MTWHCERCLRVSEAHRTHRARRSQVRVQAVRAWCRRCGDPVSIGLGDLGYAETVAQMQKLHDQPMEHLGSFHTELGGWGIFWRFDEVLALAFPRDYAADPGAPYWPVPTGFPYRYHDDRPVEAIVTSSDEDALEKERAELAQSLADHPRERVELVTAYSDVWDPVSFHDTFEVLWRKEPLLLVRRRNDRQIGTIVCQAAPRFYFDFQPTCSCGDR